MNRVILPTVLLFFVFIASGFLFGQSPDSGSGSVLDGVFPEWAGAEAEANPERGTPNPNAAQRPAENPPGSESPATGEEPSKKLDSKGSSFFEILAAGGIIGYLIILLSVAALALVIEHFMSIRANVLIPPDLAEEVLGLLAEGRLDEAKKLCGDDPSVFAYVIDAGLQEVEIGWPEVEKAVENATAEQAARLYRKIDFLSDIGNISPMLGLLGTVIGMVVAFRLMAVSDGAARAPELAGGIYLALVTTVEGLVVAIPAMGFYSFFRNRIAFLMAEITFLSEQVFHPIKRTMLAKHDITPFQQIPPVLESGIGNRE